MKIWLIGSNHILSMLIIPIDHQIIFCQTIINLLVLVLHHKVMSAELAFCMSNQTFSFV